MKATIFSNLEISQNPIYTQTSIPQIMQVNSHIYSKKMNPSNSQNQIKHHSSYKHQKKRLNENQVRLLESSFDASKKLDPERKFLLARELGVPPGQIAIWYQNKRARWKNQSLELNYGALQVNLDTALAEKRELQKEVDDLRGELKRTQDMLFGFRQPVSSLSSYCEGGASSSLNDDVGCSGKWANGHEVAALQYEEFYACLMPGQVVKGSSSGVIPNAFNNKRDYWV